MKKIALQFYGCANLGDDLFVKAFSEHFCDCRIRLVTNPKCIPAGLGPNVKIHPFSYLNLVLTKVQSMCTYDGRLWRFAQRLGEFSLKQIQKHNDAYVRIGGSIFMEHVRGCEELDFSAPQRPDFAVTSRMQEGNNSFVIGANLGPAYSEEYWDGIREKLLGYGHVCVRDYASYNMVKALPHVQYAPDVLFLIPQPKVAPGRENVVISVVDMSRHTEDEAVISAYYGLMADTAAYFANQSVPVTLVSFCQWEGDEAAIDMVREKIPQSNLISICRYADNAKEILELFSGASYIVGSRFHSIILAVSFGKPVFPIAYNCKTEHYLADLNFRGRYGNLKNLPSLKCSDVVSNYRERVVADCAEHKRYAPNQFRALERFLYPEESQTAHGRIPLFF